MLVCSHEEPIIDDENISEEDIEHDIKNTESDQHVQGLVDVADSQEHTAAYEG